MTQSKDDSRSILNKLLKFQVPQIKTTCSTPQTNKERLPSSIYIYIYIFNKEACIICQSSKGVLYKKAFERTCEKMLDEAKKLVELSLFLRLKTI